MVFKIGPGLAGLPGIMHPGCMHRPVNPPGVGGRAAGVTDSYLPPSCRRGLGGLVNGSPNDGPATVRIEHSITLEAIKKRRSMDNWGADRIVLDGLQNHLPGDSGGTKIAIKYLIGGRWHAYGKGAAMVRAGDAVQAVAFSDNGRGFDYRKLGIDFSDKPNGGSAEGAAGPVGQFGDGLKLAIASALAEGMQVEVFSRDWRAVPRWKRINVDGRRAHRLCFDVEAGGRRAIKGSRTIFHKPTAAFLRYLGQIKSKALHFRPRYSPLYSDGRGNSIVDRSGHIFVKGIFVTSDFAGRLLFGFDLNTDMIAHDRDHVKEASFGNIVGEMIAGTHDVNIIKACLSSALFPADEISLGADPLEIGHIPLATVHGASYWRVPAHPQLWKQAFEELFGERAVLETDPAASITARLSNYNVIRVRNRNFRVFLINYCKVPQDSSVVGSMDAFLLADIRNPSGVSGVSFDTSFTLANRADKWGAKRVILDALSNHMPADSHGTRFSVEVKVPLPPKGRSFGWVKWSPGMRADMAQEMRITDDGRGFHYTNLRFASSDKGSDAVGQFGQGLKMLSAAALRNGMMIKFRSADWVAAPFASAPQRVGRREEEVLCFRALEGVERMQGSVTTIRGVDDEAKRVVERLDDFVLALRQDQQYLHDAGGVRVFKEGAPRTVADGSVYNRGIFITGHHAPRLLFSYDIDTANISSDRDEVDAADLEAQVKSAIASTTSGEIVEAVLRAAGEGSGREYMEFIEAELDPARAAIWRDAFHRIFGTDAVLFTNPNRSLEATHRGFAVV
ncbi:MAG: hypothetical protein JXA24_02185, partial [Proteobacteria bacterium]|nr:hypothetical protein [Pseudomonadota bacterium]